MTNKKCPSKQSELHNKSSMIFTTNSRAGCDITWAPIPRPYHLPVHHARFDSSCLNLRERNAEMRILCKARWTNMTAITPSTACDASHSSRNHIWKSDELSENFYCNILVFLFNIKRLNILCILRAAQGVCAYV